MLNHKKGHPAVGGQTGKQLADSFEASGRRADADDRE
jgi:hypothetical protein